jgi:uncharacterized RDD family membrane protein YckC
MENNLQETSQQESIFENDHNLNDIEYATTGQRFANYIVDLISFYILAALFGVLLAFVSPQTLNDMDYESTNYGASLMDRLISLIIFGLYMGIIEGITKGKSLGKLITGTRAIYEETGIPVSFGQTMLRGFCRIVPFNPFSALGNPSYPWHDKWTKTLVVKEKSLRKNY